MSNQLTLPPQYIELEEAVLGALLLDKNAFRKVSGILTADCFYVKKNRMVYEAIHALYSKNEAVDLLTVKHKMQEMRTLEFVDGSIYLMQLTERVVSGANIESHTRILLQADFSRKLISTCQEALHAAYNQTVDIIEAIARHQDNVFSITKNLYGKQFSTMESIYESRIKEYEIPNTNGVTGIPSYYNALDEITNGWNKTDLIIIAARPAMGKTAFLLNVVKNAAIKAQECVCVFSIEMGEKQLFDRLISAHTNIPLEDLNRRNLGEKEFFKLLYETTDLISSKILIDDGEYQTIKTIESKIARTREKQPVGLIVVDYLQLMKPDQKNKQSREQEISEISRGLKGIAKKFDVPVIALSQLSRAVEQRANKQPMLSDLRESGAIEQDADLVMFLYRPEYYGINSEDYGEDTEGLVEVIVAKNRHGYCDTARLKFNGTVMKFSEDERNNSFNEYQTIENESLDL